jgi:hypothetical protein
MQLKVDSTYYDEPIETVFHQILAEVAYVSTAIQRYLFQTNGINMLPAYT